MRSEGHVQFTENKLQTCATFSTTLYTLSFRTFREEEYGKVYSNEEHIFFK
jgi:hypothetical protein